MSVIGAQITSSGEIPLLRTIIKHHIPFAPNSDLNLAPSDVRRVQPELQPWTPVMSSMADPTAAAATALGQNQASNFAGPSFKIPEQPIGKIDNITVPGRVGPIGLLSMRPNAIQKGEMLIPDPLFVPDNDPRVPPSQRGDGTKIVKIFVPTGGNLKKTKFGVLTKNPNITRSPFSFASQTPGSWFQPSQVIPDSAVPPPGYQHGSANGSRNSNPSVWQLNNEIYVGLIPNTPGIGSREGTTYPLYNANNQSGLPVGSLSVPGAPFNIDATGNGSYTAITLVNSGKTGFAAGQFVVATETITGSGAGLTLQITTNSTGNVTEATVNAPGTGYKVGDLVIVSEPVALGPNESIPAAFFVGTVEVKGYTPPQSSNFSGFGVISGSHGVGGANHQVVNLYPRISNSKGVFSAREMQPSVLAGGSLPASRLAGSGARLDTPGGLPSNVWALPGFAPGDYVVGDPDKLLYAFGFPSGQKTLLPNYLLLAGQNASPDFNDFSYGVGTPADQALKDQLIGNGLNSGQGYMQAENADSASIDQNKPASTAPNATGAVGVGFVQPKNAIGAGVSKNNTTAIPTATAFAGISRQQVLTDPVTNGATFLGQTLNGRANDQFEEVDYQVAYTATFPIDQRVRDPIRGPGITVNGRTQLASIPPGGAPPPENPLAPSI